MRYWPSRVVTVDFFTPVAPLTASTVALGMPAPLASATVPVTSPLIACPKQAPTKSNKAAIAAV
jgi:hypothetical protein